MANEEQEMFAKCKKPTEKSRAEAAAGGKQYKWQCNFRRKELNWETHKRRQEVRFEGCRSVSERAASI